MPTTTMVGSTSWNTAAEMDGSTFPPAQEAVSDITRAYLDALAKVEFKGELAADLGTRVTQSTDNSIYQIMPQAVVYPREASDLDLVMQTANEPRFTEIKLYARGGGTSTNGQSLGPGIIVDTSRHMRGILDFDPASGTIRVEPGVVRDSLNDFLAPHGCFFAPHVSTTNRATIGGMVSNDSSGKGSVVYGKTSDHVVSVECVLPSGDTVELGHVPSEEIAALAGATGDLAREIDAVLAPHADEIRARFPDLKRGFTGYNLKDVRLPNGDLNLTKLLSGSEGTLSLIKSITLRTEPIPKHTALAVLTFASHDAGLRAIPELLKSKPHAIEFIDDKIMAAALHTPFAKDVRKVLGIDGSIGTSAAHFFEMSHDDPAALDRRLSELSECLDAYPDAIRPTGIRVVRDSAEIARVWEIRLACQGLLAGFDKNKRAVAFIEDCAVPPENLADFVAELEDVLAAKKIPLGMYGHADVGCVHIRPLMNLNADDERRQIREISDSVFALTQKYGGLLWGEHGKGFRGEYSEAVIGPDLYMLMRHIKGLFDPTNRMNPGKIARPNGDIQPILALDSISMRGSFDQDVTPSLTVDFGNALRCDGNGACFNVDDSQPFCPSYKATGDRKQSPKGRASLLRAWARELALGNEDGAAALATDLNATLETCLACKACAGSGCPARVDIPEMKSQFLDWFHRSNRRPLSDIVVARLEAFAPKLDLVGGILNTLQSLQPVKSLISRVLGLVDLPKLRNRRETLRRLNDLNVTTKTVTQLRSCTVEERERIIVIVQDCFTTFYDPEALLTQLGLIRALGFSPVLLNYRPGGKPLHVRGLLPKFRKIAEANARDLSILNEAGLTMIGVDGATTLMYRHEYPANLNDCPDFKVLLLSEWLVQIDLPKVRTRQAFQLIQHCTERSLAPETTDQWIDIFQRMDMDVSVVNTGCCGMSGLFGHEATHQEMSKTLYEHNWQEAINGELNVIATGYSCRSQVKRFSDTEPLIPAKVLLDALSYG